jgi:hypothetical protein
MAPVLSGYVSTIEDGPGNSIFGLRDRARDPLVPYVTTDDGIDLPVRARLVVPALETPHAYGVALVFTPPEAVDALIADLGDVRAALTRRAPAEED